MTSGWKHPICEDCWVERYGERVPVRVVESVAERCCYCGEVTMSGIYVRDAPHNHDVSYLADQEPLSRAAGESHAPADPREAP